jgi:hypothetical protein
MHAHNHYAARSNGGWREVARGIAVLVELIGVGAQGVMIYLLLDARHHAGCGEQCAMAAMGLVALLSAVAPLTLLATVIALVLLVRARRAYRMESATRWAMAPHAIIAAMPIALFAALNASGRPLPDDPPPARFVQAPMTDRDQYVAGAAFANDNGIDTTARCTALPPSTSKAYVDGCLNTVRRHAGPAAAR